jgi:hypothetical protein
MKIAYPEVSTGSATGSSVQGVIRTQLCNIRFIDTKLQMERIAAVCEHLNEDIQLACNAVYVHKFSSGEDTFRREKSQRTDAFARVVDESIQICDTRG